VGGWWATVLPALFFLLRRSDQYGVMASRCRNFQRPFYIFLPFYIAEVDIEIALRLRKFFPGIYECSCNVSSFSKKRITSSR
jgi:hypothetical protein